MVGERGINVESGNLDLNLTYKMGMTPTPFSRGQRTGEDLTGSGTYWLCSPALAQTSRKASEDVLSRPLGEHIPLCHHGNIHYH